MNQRRECASQTNGMGQERISVRLAQLAAKAPRSDVVMKVKTAIESLLV